MKDKMEFRYYFEEKPKNSTTKGIVLDSDGYKYYASEADIKKNLQRYTRLRIFGRANPFSIENINHYLKVNGINAVLLSEEFDPVNLQWRCECGQVFIQQWSVFKNSHHVCQDCSKRIIGQKNARPFVESLRILQEFHPGYQIISSDYEEGTYIYAINPSGYKVSFRRSELNKGEPLEFDTSNPFTIDNIKKWTELHTHGEYICISDTYVNTQEPLQFYHIHCKYTSNITWGNFRNSKNKKTGRFREGQRCSICASLRNESQHAAILKQLFIKYYPDTILEDNSCRGLKGVPLPTDIVNHRLKLAIEIQSAYHDRPEQKRKDQIKKEFWVNKGYRFKNPDIRDYSYLELAQLFFPQLTVLPEWILYDFSYKLDTVKVQELFDMGYTVREIAEMLKINKSVINNAIATNRVFYPEENKRKAKNIRRIVQCSLDGKVIAIHDSIQGAGKMLGGGHKAERIRLHLKGKFPDAEGYFWLYEDEYDETIDIAELYRRKKEDLEVEQQLKKENLLEKRMIQLKKEFFELFGKDIRYFPSKKEFELKNNSTLRNQILHIYSDVNTVCKEYGLMNHDELLIERFKCAFPEATELPAAKRFEKTGHKSLWGCLVRRYKTRDEIAKALGVTYNGI